ISRLRQPTSRELDKYEYLMRLKLYSNAWVEIKAEIYNYKKQREHMSSQFYWIISAPIAISLLLPFCFCICRCNQNKRTNRTGQTESQRPQRPQRPQRQQPVHTQPTDFAISVISHSPPPSYEEAMRQARAEM
ncbi:hypothetical protein BOX15_Mlig029306g1, partial [Macrostomum lignano]